MDTLPTLNIQDIINKAHLKNVRCPDGPLIAMLFQTLKNKGHEAKLKFKLIADPGRSVQETVFALEYQGELWSIRGKGDWDRQFTLAMSRQTQTWKNPQYAPLGETEEDAIALAFSTDPLRIYDKVRARIEASVSLAEAKTLSASTDQPVPTRSRSARL